MNRRDAVSLLVCRLCSLFTDLRALIWDSDSISKVADGTPALCDGYISGILNTTYFKILNALEITDDENTLYRRLLEIELTLNKCKKAHLLNEHLFAKRSTAYYPQNYLMFRSISFPLRLDHRHYSMPSTLWQAVTSTFENEINRPGRASRFSPDVMNRGRAVFIQFLTHYSELISGQEPHSIEHLVRHFFLSLDAILGPNDFVYPEAIGPSGMDF